MSFLEVLMIGRMMRRNGNDESRMIAALFAGRKRLALHHCHLVFILVDSIVHDVVDSGFWAEIARFELIHKLFYARAGRSAPWPAGASSAILRRGGVAINNSSDPAKHNPAME
jgi:hypothetical protein